MHYPHRISRIKRKRAIGDGATGDDVGSDSSEWSSEDSDSDDSDDDAHDGAIGGAGTYEGDEGGSGGGGGGGARGNAPAGGDGSEWSRTIFGWSLGRLRRIPTEPFVRQLTSTRRTAAYDSYDSVAPMTPTISKAESVVLVSVKVCRGSTSDSSTPRSMPA